MMRGCSVISKRCNIIIICSDSVGWSSRIEFKTPPAAGSEELHFLIYGDMGKAPLDPSVEHYIQVTSFLVFPLLFRMRLEHYLAYFHGLFRKAHETFSKKDSSWSATILLQLLQHIQEEILPGIELSTRLFYPIWYISDHVVFRFGMFALFDTHTAWINLCCCSNGKRDRRG